MSVASEIFLSGVLSKEYTVTNRAGSKKDSRPRLDGVPMPVTYTHQGEGFQYTVPAGNLAALLAQASVGSVITVSRSEDYPYTEQYRKTDRGWLAVPCYDKVYC